MTFSPDGDLSRFDPLDIAEASGFEVDEDAGTEWVRELIDCGFLERDGERLVVHDWDEYSGRLEQQRQANAARMREYRSRWSDEPPQSGVGMPPGPASAVVPLDELSEGATAQDNTCDARNTHVTRTSGERAGLEERRGEERREEDLDVAGAVAPAVGGSDAPVSKPERPRDEVFEALAEVEGVPLDDTLTKTIRGRLNRQAAEAKAAKLTPADIREVAGAWKREHPTIACSAQVVLRHANRILAKSRGSRSAPQSWPAPWDDPDYVPAPPIPIPERDIPVAMRGLRRDPYVARGEG